MGSALAPGGGWVLSQGFGCCFFQGLGAVSGVRVLSQGFGCCFPLRVWVLSQGFGCRWGFGDPPQVPPPPGSSPHLHLCGFLGTPAVLALWVFVSLSLGTA